MVVLTNEGRRAGSRPLLVKTCKRCKVQLWFCEFPHLSAQRCKDCTEKLSTKPCKHCGGPSGRTVRNESRRFCSKPECQEACRLYKGACAGRARTNRSASRKTKRCPQCGVTKQKTLEFFAPRTRDGETGEVLRFHGWCRDCAAAVRRDQYANDPELRERQRVQRQKSHRLKREALAADPDALRAARAKWAADKREQLRRKREAPPVVVESKPQGYSGTGPLMPVTPLWDAIARFMEDRDLTRTATAAMFGVNERALYRWEHEGNWVRLEQADAALVAMDLLWFEVWDESEYPDVAKIWEGEA